MARIRKNEMRAWSLPLGRWFGVHLRIHYFFLLLLLFCVLSTNLSGIASWRGVFLWFLLFGAVLGREAARALTAAYHGLAVRSILLLPIGGLFSYSSPEMAERAVEGPTQWALTVAVPGPTVAGTASRDGKDWSLASPLQVSSTVISERAPEAITDDRANLQPDDAILLIVEDDPHYARVLCDLAHDKGFKVLAAMRGADALGLAHEYHPTAVSLDVFLPDMLGWTVLNHLKQDPATRHIPVQMLTLDEDRRHGLARGAFSFLTKPTTSEGVGAALDRIKEFSAPRRKRLLIVEDNPAEQLGTRELLSYDDIDITVVSTGQEALGIVGQQQFDCVVLDLRLPDMSGFDVLETFRDNPLLSDLPVVVFTGKELSPEEDARLRALARSVVVKGVESPERLLDETALFLHRVVADLPT